MSNKAYAICGMIKQLSDADLERMSTAGLNHLVSVAGYLSDAAMCELRKRFEDTVEAEHRRARAPRDLPVQANADLFS